MKQLETTIRSMTYGQTVELSPRDYRLAQKYISAGQLVLLGSGRPVCGLVTAQLQED